MRRTDRGRTNLRMLDAGYAGCRHRNSIAREIIEVGYCCKSTECTVVISLEFGYQNIETRHDEKSMCELAILGFPPLHVGGNQQSYVNVWSSMFVLYAVLLARVLPSVLLSCLCVANVWRASLRKVRVVAPLGSLGSSRWSN